MVRVSVYVPPSPLAVKVIHIVNRLSMTFTALSKGGEYTHAITIDEMPSHKHDISAPIASTWTNAGGSSIQGSDQRQSSYNFNWCKEVGGNKPHNNLPPYTTVYRWQRVS